MFVTDGRGEQGLGKVCENDEKPSKAHTAKFIQWMVADVQKESATELEVIPFSYFCVLPFTCTLSLFVFLYPALSPSLLPSFISLSSTFSLSLLSSCCFLIAYRQAG
jgi:hypothetical protein